MHLEVVAVVGQADGGGPGGGLAGGPISVRRPWVTQSGRRLVCHKGTWKSARTFAYNWYVDGSLRRTTSPRPIAPLPRLPGPPVQLQGHRLRSRRHVSRR